MDKAKELLNVPTTPYDLFRIAGKKCNVFTYPEISKFKFYTQLFKKGNSEYANQDDGLIFDDSFCIILYLTGERCGHWTCISRNRNGINFLDSYGDVIDDQLKHVDSSIFGQNKKHLVKLMQRANKPIYYNDLQIQRFSSNIATCGRYCALYLKYDHMLIDDFVKTLLSKAKEYSVSPDMLVCLLSL